MIVCQYESNPNQFTVIIEPEPTDKDLNEDDAIYGDLEKRMAHCINYSLVPEDTLRQWIVEGFLRWERGNDENF